MLMWWPRGPVAGAREGNAGHNATRLDIAAQQYVQVSLGGWFARYQMKLGILPYFGVGNELQRVAFGNGGGDLRQITT